MKINNTYDIILLKDVIILNRFIKVCETILFIFFLVLLPFLTNKLSTIISLVIIVVFYLLEKKINIKHYSIFLFLLALLIRIITTLTLNVSIVDDFKTMLDASRLLLKGNTSFLNSFYFRMFPYQLGHVLYQTSLLRIINSTLFLKIVNSIITSLIVVFIYLISKNIFKEETARKVSLLYLLYLYPLYLNSVLTNQHLPALLTLISIYLFLTKPHNYKTIIQIGLILSVSNIFRSESIIIIFGLIVFLLLTSTKKSIKTNAISIITLIFVYLLSQLTFSIFLQESRLNTKFQNNAPYWKFYCGLSDKYNGLFNEEDQEVFFNSDNQKELLLERVKSDKNKLPKLFLKKEVILWTQTNYDLRINNNINQKLYNFLLNFNQGFLNVIILLSVITLFPYKEKTNDKVLLIKIILFLYYGIYMFIEISPRYAYILHLLLFLIIGISIERINDIIKKRCKYAKI